MNDTDTRRIRPIHQQLRHGWAVRRVETGIRRPEKWAQARCAAGLYINSCGLSTKKPGRAGRLAVLQAATRGFGGTAQGVGATQAVPRKPWLGWLHAV